MITSTNYMTAKDNNHFWIRNERGETGGSVVASGVKVCDYCSKTYAWRYVTRIEPRIYFETQKWEEVKEDETD